MKDLRFAVLGSGSQSNSYIVNFGPESYVFDNGFTLKEFKKRCREEAFHLDHIQGIFLTHNHGDHIRGLEALAKDRRVPIYHHAGTRLKGFIKDPSVTGVPLQPGQSYRFGNLDLYPFPLHHDAPNALGYHFKLGHRIFTLITDTGKTDELMHKLALRSDVLFLESNYCPRLLAQGPYPPHLKARVASDQGHLSNQQALEFLNSLGAAGGGRLSQVYLIHLSANNNSPDEVEKVFQMGLKWKIPWRVCRRGELVASHAGISWKS